MKALQGNLKAFLATSAKGNSKVVLVRKGESVSNYGGLLCGWLDPRLTFQGRQQANLLYQGLHPFISSFETVLSSDLRRCTEFADIALGFDGLHGKRLLTVDRRLREIDFGKDDGLHYDTLSPAEKARIDSIDYKAPQGESWLEVRHRFTECLAEYSVGRVLAFTHGGTICSLTYSLGLENMVPPGSVLGLDFNSQQPTSSSIAFVWEHREGE